ncbi:serine kinase [Dyella acidisoli]|uniref:Serine kinase n=1 Tax=Dyella acidisoli TaxID=1867834 RepID=A0ABQ5XW32_9GAMM|nr:serine kinase [Dyella acidisoli]GLQ95547.1 hypothetical protein GCM10007901_45030 [Dyella acidisoli]
MTATANHVIHDIQADPFGERFSRHLAVHKQLLGGSFYFESASEALLDLVEAAYGGLPPHRLPITVPDFRIELQLVPHRDQPYIIEPPQVQMHSGAGVLCGVIDASNYVVISPAQHRALVVASEDMLDFPYHLRYELIEFAVFILATRGLGLVPLHGACVGRNGHGLLLLGASGAGKSTMALHSLLNGLDFLSEDAVFVHPETLLATGVANYVHVKPDALRFIEHEAARDWIGKAPVIRRRSGVEKFEADLRHSHGQIAASPLKLVGAVFVSSEQETDLDALLSFVPSDEIAARLHADQPYAAGQPGWLHFQQKMVQTGVHELRRGEHPQVSIEALMRLLDRL